MVRQLGCRKIQGYYFGRPMSADESQLIFKRAAAKLARGGA
jgi:EAL domain-containing protein (putative c-di-GMP-specific phosphodiesterase class I)